MFIFLEQKFPCCFLGKAKNFLLCYVIAAPALKKMQSSGRRDLTSEKIVLKSAKIDCEQYVCMPLTTYATQSRIFTNMLLWKSFDVFFIKSFLAEFSLSSIESESTKVKTLN